jgi:DNA-directed RNA polymerase specialized sigma24 family protein
VIARVPAEVQDEIVRLRGQYLTYREIAAVVGLRTETVRRFCQEYFGDRVARAREALRREVNLARAEAHTAPLFHPVDWR